MDPFKKQIMDFRALEFAITMKVLRSYPEDKLDMRPAEKSRTARELIVTFIREEYVCRGVMPVTWAGQILLNACHRGSGA